MNENVTIGCLSLVVVLVLISLIPGAWKLIADLVTASVGG